MKLYATLVLLLLYAIAQAQFTDNFTDGDFSNNPCWYGNTGAFGVNVSNQLQLDTSGADLKQLFTANSMISETEWQFWIKLNFDPSASNMVKIYLASDQPDLNGNLNGYYIKIGENGVFDGIDLYRQSGLNSTLLINGKDKHAAIKPTLRIKVIHKSSGEWLLSSDTTGNFDFNEEGCAMDNSISTSSFSGIVCKFTSTYAKQFFFDDFYVGPISKDTIPPKIYSIEILNDHQLKIIYNESVNKNSAEDPNHYFVDNHINLPYQVDLSGNKTTTLFFTASLSQNILYHLVIKDIQDQSGNITSKDSTVFFRYIPAKGDIVINEFLADPFPSQGLPGSEFIELFNATSYPFPIDLNNWKLGDASASASLPAFSLKAGEYLILSNPIDTSAYKSFGKVMGIAGFPSLNNAVDIIKIKSDGNLLIDSLEYDIFWYRDAIKSDGGWSLERINPLHPCSDQFNWLASTYNDGGTPGSKNSVFSVLPDHEAPEIISISVIDSLHLNITFNENTDTTSLLVSDFNLNCSKNIDKLIIMGLKRLLLTVSFPFSPNDTCSINLKGIRDCYGNEDNIWQYYGFKYIVPQKAEANDIIITEVFPDPDPTVGLPNYEFIELFNRSNKYISLENLSIMHKTTKINIGKFIIAPDSYLILCPFLAYTKFDDFGTKIGLTTFPSLNNNGDEIFILDDNGKYIFDLKYESSWYQDNDKKDGGWTLEMIDPQNFCSEKDNWKASENLKGGTPGMVNSVKDDNPDTDYPFITKVISWSPTQIAIFFNEKMDTNSLINPSNYMLDNRLPQNFTLSNFLHAFNMVIINVSDSLKKKTIYHLNCSGLTDCAGNILDGIKEFDFGMFEYADSSDLIVNEILFNPYSGGSDFIELYNRTEKILSLKNIEMASLNEDHSTKEQVKIPDSMYQVLPGDYVVITADPNDIVNRYTVKFPLKIIPMSNFLSFNDDIGQIRIYNSTEKVIDDFSYSDKMHFPLLDNTEGVSLERINPDAKTNNISNWHSAASKAGYASPTYINSEFTELKSPENEFLLNSEVFSPDGDGYQDELIINFKFNSSGNYGSVKLYDINGREVRMLVNNELFGTEGFFAWDGTNDHGGKCTEGVYILVININRTDGYTKKFKLTCTLVLI